MKHTQIVILRSKLIFLSGSSLEPEKVAASHSMKNLSKAYHREHQSQMGVKISHNILHCKQCSYPSKKNVKAHSGSDLRVEVENLFEENGHGRRSHNCDSFIPIRGGPNGIMDAETNIMPYLLLPHGS